MRHSETLRRILVYAAYILVASMLQFHWPDRWSAWGVKPDFTLVFVILAGYLFGFIDGVTIGLITGFIRDALGSRYFGSGMLYLFLAGVLAATLFQKKMNRNAITVFLSIAVITAIMDGLILLIQYILVTQSGQVIWPISILSFMAKRLLPLELLNLLWGLVLLPFFKNLGPYHKKKQRDRLYSEAAGRDYVG